MSDPYKAGQAASRNNQNVPKQSNYRAQQQADAGYLRAKEGKK